MHMDNRLSGFDWDEGNRDKCQKHGLTLQVIEGLFSRTLQTGPDPFTAEPRFRAVGRAEDGRAVFLVFTLRERNGEVFVRPISARYMHQKEVKAYEEEIPEISE